jgi:2-deoxy-D-gluconate 3-dehydrogenase
MNKNVFEQFRLEDQVIIITGGCGLLGQEYALTVGQAGGHAVIADLRGPQAAKVAEKVSAETGTPALGVQVDISDKPSVQALVAMVLDRFGRIDGLVNNAAVNPEFGGEEGRQFTADFESYPLEMWNQSVAVNLTGMFLCTQAVVPAMLRQRKGVIVNIASTYSLVAPDQRLYEQDDPDALRTFKPVDYPVTKTAVIGFTKYLAAYYGDKNIRVNTLTPHGVYNDHDDAFMRRYNARTPLGRMSRRDEYNAALLFLLSDASSYMTGNNLIIDGGWTAW